MANASQPPWMGFVFPVLVTGLCLWLAYGAIATGMAGYHESNDDGERARGWRASSPTALALEAERLIRREDHDAGGDLARQALGRSSLHADALRTLAQSASARDRADETPGLMS